MKRIVLLRGVCIRGQGYPEGQVLEVDDNDARILIQMGKASLSPSEPEPEPELAAVSTETKTALAGSGRKKR